MDRNSKAGNGWKEKFAEFCGTALGKGIVSAAFTVIGYGINVSIQASTNSSVKKILSGLNNENSNASTEQIEEVLNGFFSPLSLSSFIFAFLWFFLGLVFTELICQSIPRKDMPEATADSHASGDTIVDLLRHMTEQVYNRCSNSTEHCSGCSKFASEEDGLLRRYLYEDSRNLQKAIIKSKNGQYALDNNIPQYHTFAITHMLGTLGAQYSVIQWIGSREYTDQNKYDETYDALDFDFLYTLLKEVTKPYAGNASDIPYYKKDLGEGKRFKIKWVLIGKIECMKNNFDYIFYVIKQLSQDNKLSFEEQARIVSRFFDFYIIEEEQYRREINQILRNYNGENCRRLFILENQPSLGIFGNQFMFVDSLDRGSHGSMYTRKYAPDGNAQSLLDASIAIFEQILAKATKTEFSKVLAKYNSIIGEDKEWETQLKTIWNQDNVKGDK